MIVSFSRMDGIEKHIRAHFAYLGFPPNEALGGISDEIYISGRDSERDNFGLRVSFHILILSLPKQRHLPTARFSSSNFAA